MEARTGAAHGVQAFPVIGAILLATDLTTERDIRALVPETTAVCATRVAFENPTRREKLIQTLPHLAGAASLLVPGVDLAALYFSCTSATISLGETVVRQAIHEARPGVPVVTPLAAAQRAFASFGARRIAVMTPYVSETAQLIVNHLEDGGIEVVNALALEIEDDRDMARMAPEAIIEAAVAAMHPQAEALFISCTALPAARLAPQIEARAGCPVVTSNLAGLWLAQRLAGEPVRQDRGLLMSMPLVEMAD